MKLHSVVDTITNSSSVEFMIPNPDGVMSKEEFKELLAAALVDDFKTNDQYATSILLDYLPRGYVILQKYKTTEWFEIITSWYKTEEINTAALQWVNGDIKIQWSKNSILCFAPTPLPARVENLINKLKQTENKNIFRKI